MFRSVARALVAAAVMVAAASSCSHQCDAESCPDGCCDEDGICWVNPSDLGESHCGIAGAACQSCSYSESCVKGTCCGGRDAACSTAADCCGGLSCVPGYLGHRICGGCGRVGSPCETSADCCTDGNVKCWQLSSGDKQCACGKTGYLCDADSDCCPGGSCRLNSYSGYNECT